MEDVHSLAASYALDALDANEESEFERHLALCERCREELAALREAAGALAYAPDAPAPPAELRDRILAQARAERPKVVPLRPRRWLRPGYTAAAAAAAACAAIGLGVWAETLSNKLDRKQEALAVLADPAARRIPLSGATGSLVIAHDGKAVLVTGLRHAPSGKTYEAWLIRAGKATKAGLFRGGGRSLVLVPQALRTGDVVAVTVERAGGVEQPTRRPLLHGEAA
ncbi:MAG: anti-sigma factor [Gaiellaceae bacterium]